MAELFLHPSTSSAWSNVRSNDDSVDEISPGRNFHWNRIRNCDWLTISRPRLLRFLGDARASDLGLGGIRLPNVPDNRVVVMATRFTYLGKFSWIPDIIDYRPVLESKMVKNRYLTFFLQILYFM